MRRDALLCAGEAQSLLGGRLDRHLLDRAADGGGKVLAHLQDVRRQLGRLCQHGRIQIAELPAALAHERGNVPQQRDAVRALVARVGVREVPPDVAERECAEQRIHDRVREHIRIRVAVQSELERNIHAADDAPPSGNEPVYVITVSDPHISSPPCAGTPLR